MGHFCHASFHNPQPVIVVKTQQKLTLLEADFAKSGPWFTKGAVEFRSESDVVHSFEERAAIGPPDGNFAFFKKQESFTKGFYSIQVDNK